VGKNLLNIVEMHTGVTLIYIYIYIYIQIRDREFCDYNLEFGAFLKDGFRTRGLCHSETGAKQT